MNRTLPDMLHCLNTPGNMAANGATDISVLERQRTRMKWQQEQLQRQHNFFDGNELSVFSIQAQAQQFQSLMGNDSGVGLKDLGNRVVKPDPGTENRWADYGKFGGDDHLDYGACGYGNESGFEMSCAISKTASCPPAVAAAIAAAADKSKGRESFKKRKFEDTHNLKVVPEEETKQKKIKACAEEGDSKITEEKSNIRSTNNNSSSNNNNNRETSTDTSKENSKVSGVQKTDYIHVRARRGQATDSHSLAERVRREKISERMKYLQDLVPGCNKITGKAGMLDEIINYVQSLQRQVEFLSMKLAAVNPRLDFNMDNLFTKEMFTASTSDFPTNCVSPEMVNPSYFQLNPLQQQVVSCFGLEMGMNPPDIALRRTTSSPVAAPETLLDSFCFNQMQPPLTWDAELQNVYVAEFQQGRPTSFPSHSFTGSMEGGNLKMEM